MTLVIEKEKKNNDLFIFFKKNCWITWGRKNSFMLDCLIRGDKDSPQTKIVLGQRYFICQSLLKFEANYFFSYE